MKEQIKLHRVFILILVCAIWGLSSSSPRPSFAGQASTQLPVADASPHISIRAWTASINETNTRALATAWVFNRMGGRLFYINPSSEEVPGEMAAILRPSQIYPLISLCEQMHSLHSFPGITNVNGRAGLISLDDGQSLAITPIVSADGLSVELTITATLKELGSGQEKSLRATTLTANIRDEQGVLLGETGGRRQSQPQDGDGSKLIIVVASITDAAGERLHPWDEVGTSPRTRLYRDQKPHAHPAIPPQHP